MMQWTDERWHVDGRGVHAGDMLELRCGDGRLWRWMPVRIESKDSGRELYAYLQLDPPLDRFNAVSRIVTPDMVSAWKAERERDREAGFPVSEDGWQPDLLRWPARR